MYTDGQRSPDKHPSAYGVYSCSVPAEIRAEFTKTGPGYATQREREREREREKRGELVCRLQTFGLRAVNTMHTNEQRISSLNLYITYSPLRVF